MQNDRRQSLIKVALVLASALVILSASLYSANQNQTLENVLTAEGVPSFSNAEVTSIEYLSEENFFTYQLEEKEVKQLKQILATQEVNRSYFNSNQGSTFNYRINLRTSGGDTLLDVSSENVHIQETNLYYELKNDHLDTFMSEIFETHGN